MSEKELYVSSTVPFQDSSGCRKHASVSVKRDKNGALLAIAFDVEKGRENIVFDGDGIADIMKLLVQLMRR